MVINPKPVAKIWHQQILVRWTNNSVQRLIFSNRQQYYRYGRGCITILSGAHSKTQQKIFNQGNQTVKLVATSIEGCKSDTALQTILCKPGAQRYHEF